MQPDQSVLDRQASPDTQQPEAIDAYSDTSSDAFSDPHSEPYSESDTGADFKSADNSAESMTAAYDQTGTTDADPPFAGAAVDALNGLNPTGKTEGLLTDYAMQHLQLRSQPFVGSSAEGELFADELTFAQINEIRQAILNGESLILLIGEIGAGKSTLLKQLTRNTGHRLQYFSVKGGEKYASHNLFNGILDAWKLEAPSEFEDSVNLMLQGLQACQERNSLVVLLLDDADLIPARELNLLLASVQYFNTDETLLNVVLSAEPAFEEGIPDLLHEGMQVPYSSLSVEPLLASRAKPYIQLRLNQAGHFDEFPLNDNQVSQIANDASGLPGRINFLTAETLNTICSPFPEAEATTKTAGLLAGKPVGKYLLGALAVALIGIGLLWKGPADDNSASTTVETVPVGKQTSKTVSNDTGAALDSQSNNSSSTSAVASNNGNANTRTEANTGDAGPADLTQNGTATTASVSSSANNDANQSESSATGATLESANREVGAAVDEISAVVGAEAAAVSDTVSAVANDPSSTATASAAQNSARSAETNPQSSAPNAGEAAQTAATTQTPGKPVLEDTDAELPVAESETSSASSISTPAETVATDSVTGNPTPNPAATATLESPNWVLLQDPARYTVQMSASTDNADVQRFLARSGLEGPNSIYSFERRGVTWYALVHGLFDNASAAGAAVEAMSSQATSNQPWIRRIGGIQKSLKSGGG